MTKHTITLNTLDLSITYSVKDNSPRGCHTVAGSELKPGDKIVIDNYFHEIIEEPTEATTEPTEATTRSRADVVRDILDYFTENPTDFEQAIEELDSYNGFLGDDRYYEMEMLTDIYHGIDPIELLQRAYYGRDDDSWHTDSRGEKVYGAFNPNRDYFYYNGYGNLVSSDYKDYSAHLDEWAVDDMLENRQYIDTIDDNIELSVLFDELEQCESEV